MPRPPKQDKDVGPLGRYIRKLREQIPNLTQKKLGELSGQGRGMIDSLERGTNRHPGSGVLESIAPHLKVSVESLQWRGELIDYETFRNKSNPHRVAQQLLSALPELLPVYGTYPKGSRVNVVDDRYFARELVSTLEQPEVYLVTEEYDFESTFSLGDVILVDRKGRPVTEGDFAVGRFNGTVALGRFVASDSQRGIATARKFYPDCTDVSRVVQFTRTLGTI